jgi:mRNA interferase RelE/StbE
LAWTIELADTALRQLGKLDRLTARRILKFLDLRIAPLKNLRCIGEALQGERLGEFWKYRVADYRLVARIENDRLVVLVLRVGHRRDVYR